MAKPIRATPELYRDDAKRFLALMTKKEKSKMTKKELEIAKAIKTLAL